MEVWEYSMSRYQDVIIYMKHHIALVLRTFVSAQSVESLESKFMCSVFV